ncbi:MAG: phage Gp37/Gp68 family protein [Nitrospinae bacterium]|nr:phage Gp37/Gp68 family protein [Nitrospinota bacterium]
MTASTKHGTGIEWTHIPGYRGERWNPVTGCTKVSDGCTHCYAEGIAKRFWGDRDFTDVQCHDDRLEIPLHWPKPRAIFVNSMSDLFHEDVAFEFIDQVLALAALCTQHIFMVLTKRPERMVEYFKDDTHKPLAETRGACVGREVGYILKERGEWKQEWETVDPYWWSWPLPNLWLGVSIEDQQTADQRIPELLKAPAAVRFVSYEPALGPVDFTHMDVEKAGHKEWCFINALTGDHTDMGRPCPPVPKLDWIICGGESGPGARPMDLQWARDARDQCRDANVPFFMKQIDKKQPIPDDLMVRQFPEVMK